MFTDKQLHEASQKGETKAAEALSVLSKCKVNVKTKEVSLVSESEAVKTLDNIEGHASIAYSKILTGFEGACILTLTRQDALDMVDLFNNRPIGTTVALQELDRSTIRETLNILSNSYITELANLAGITVLLSVPYMITKDKIPSVVGEITPSINRAAALFQTDLTVEGVEFNLKLYFFFITRSK